MPPRFAKPGASRLKHTRPLSARELDTIVDWAAGGAPPGKPSSAASTPSTTATTALDQTWRRHVLDLTLPSGKDAVTLLRTLSPDDAAKTIRGWTIEPDAADSPLRHVLLFAVSGTDKTAPHSAFDSWTAVPRAWRPASGFLGSWLPDQPPQEWPKGWGRPWHANDRLVLLATLRRSFKHGNTPRRARAALRVLWEAQAPQVALRAAPVSEVSEASTENARVVGFFPGATTGPATLSIVSATTNEAPAEPILEILHAPAAWPATYWLDPAQPLIKTSQLRWRPSAEVQAPGIIVTAP